MQNSHWPIPYGAAEYVEAKSKPTPPKHTQYMTNLVTEHHESAAWIFLFLQTTFCAWQLELIHSTGRLLLTAGACARPHAIPLNLRNT